MDEISQRIANLSPEKRKILLEKLRSHRQSEIVPAQIPKRTSKNPSVLSSSQQRLWFLDRLDPGNSVYNIPLILKFKGNLELEKLQVSLSSIVSRHEALRTIFIEQEGEPAQLIQPAQPVELKVIDVSNGHAESHAREISREPFDLSAGPLVRFSLLKLNEEEHWLLVVMHHIISDGWSLSVFQRELILFYTGKPEQVAELPFQFADFSIWQQDQLSTFEEEVTYWRNVLSGATSTIDLPTDRPRPVRKSFRGARLRTVLPPELIHALEELAKGQGSTIFMVLLAALNILMARYSGQSDISIGCPIAGRKRKDLENLIGVFINTIVLRNDLSGQPSFIEFLGRVREVALGAFSHQNVPFEKLIEELQPDRDLTHSPFFQILLVLQNQEFLDSSMGSIEIDRDFVGMDTAMFDLSFYIHPNPDGYLVKVEYSTDIFEEPTIENLMIHFRILLQSIVDGPSTSVWKLNLLPEEEKTKLLGTWNNTDFYYPNQATVPQLITEQATRTPEAIAVEFEGITYSYSQLEACSNSFARHLQAIGVVPQTPVGIFIERSFHMLVALLGTMKAGGFYVPLDPAFPSDRLAYMVKDAEVKFLLTESTLLDRLPSDTPKVILMDVDNGTIAESSSSDFSSSTTPDSMAYVIYTSGSTGQPKGVMIQQRALVNFLCAMKNQPGIQSSDRLLAITTLSFDIAGLELYLPLICGACVVIASRTEALDGRLLSQKIQSCGATIMQATPATWRMLLDENWSGDPNIKLLCGGESLPRELSEGLLERCGELWNVYGPTETTVWSTVKQIFSKEDGSICIGRPIANTKIFLLDAFYQLVPIGVPGELCIGGVGLAKGYLNREKLTKEKFVSHTFKDDVLLYHTGDLGRYQVNGDIELLGRLDHQVKIRGFRIELGEIESVLETHPGVRQSVVIADTDSSGGKRLVAYYLMASIQEDSLNIRELREYLKLSLPDYMVPSLFVVLDSLPLTPNGKVNRKALPPPIEIRSDYGEGYLAPQTVAQKELVDIWAEVLGIPKVGIRDNFFDLGGHSLLALRLVSKMEKVLGRRIPVIALFQGRTIEDLVSESEATSSKFPQAISAIRSTGSMEPFFSVGSHPRYVDVAKRIHLEQPFYRLDAYALQSGRVAQGLKAYRSVEALTGEFVAAIQKLQPKGPYFLGGGCEGALIAFAIATELQRRGETVAKLIVWITPAPHYANGAVFGRSAPFRVLNQLKALLSRARMSDLNIRTFIEIVKHEYIEYRIFRAMDNYAPTSKFEGEIVLARTIEDRHEWDVDLAMGWGDFSTKGVSVHQLSGNHKSWLVDYTEDFGNFLESRLKPARENLKKTITFINI